MTNPLLAIGLTRPLVSILMRDPDQLQDFLRKYKQVLVGYAHTDTGKATTKESQDILEALQSLTDRTMGAERLKAICLDYLNGDEEEAYGIRLQLRDAQQQAASAALSLAEQEKEHKKLAGRLNAYWLERIRVMGRLYAGLAAGELGELPDGSLRMDRFARTALVSLDSVLPKATTLSSDNLGKPVKSLAYRVVYIDDALQVFVSSGQREFYGGNIGHRTARRLTDPPPLSDAVAQLEAELSPQIEKLLRSGPDNGWSAIGTLIGFAAAGAPQDFLKSGDLSVRSMEEIRHAYEHGMLKGHANPGLGALGMITIRVTSSLKKSNDALVVSDGYEAVSTPITSTLLQRPFFKAPP